MEQPQWLEKPLRAKRQLDSQRQREIDEWKEGREQRQAAICDAANRILRVRLAKYGLPVDDMVIADGKATQDDLVFSALLREKYETGPYNVTFRLQYMINSGADGADNLTHITIWHPEASRSTAPTKIYFPDDPQQGDLAKFAEVVQKVLRDVEQKREQDRLLAAQRKAQQEAAQREAEERRQREDEAERYRKQMERERQEREAKEREERERRKATHVFQSIPLVPGNPDSEQHLAGLDEMTRLSNLGWSVISQTATSPEGRFHPEVFVLMAAPSVSAPAREVYDPGLDDAGVPIYEEG